MMPSSSPFHSCLTHAAYRQSKSAAIAAQAVGAALEGLAVVATVAVQAALAVGSC